MAYLGLGTPAAAEWAAFGAGILGLQAIERGEDGALRFRMDDAECRLWVHPGERNDIAYIGWTLADEDAAAALGKRIEAAGLPLTRATPGEARARCVAGYYWFTDPAGFRQELTWGQFLSPATFQPGRPMSGFRTGDQGMGHIVLLVPDLAVCDRFYREAMGFNISDRIVDGSRELLFYHCNGRHHSLAIGSPGPGISGAHHLMLEVNALDDVGIAVDLCGERGFPVSKSIGCHTNDRMVSAYLFSPSVLRIEYGVGGVAIDDLWEPKSYSRTSIWGHHELRPDLPPAMIVER
ncbi:VOC family protein [Sphingomonas canadensis]|uniref:VOC family protein n=1 Tax=Sphingomonas canadensis TaxID=1219257 RepID=A0ABW3H7Q8_9SPHN|nr:VOC family protein [Sphingomonas canadensis]MCW3837001.1 VOC family protein [Sphingomonas canadensis]